MIAECGIRIAEYPSPHPSPPRGEGKGEGRFGHLACLPQGGIEILYHFSLLKNESQKPKKLKESP